jgi:hypothetical protein
VNKDEFPSGGKVDPCVPCVVKEPCMLMFGELVENEPFVSIPCSFLIIQVGWELMRSIVNLLHCEH